MTTCSEHLHICNAECCKSFIITPNCKDFSKLKKGSEISFRKPCSSSKQFYFELHGAKYKHGIISIKLDEFRIHNNSIVVLARCQGLSEDNKCIFHGTNKQPECCRYPNVNGTRYDIVYTPNCAFRGNNESV